jgi:hypothetical protein
MVCNILLSSNYQRLATLLAHQDDRDLSYFLIDVEENTVLAKQSKLTMRDRVRT